MSGLAVVTVVSGRHAHLRAQRAHLRMAGAGVHVVVAVGDPGIADVVAEEPRLDTVLVHHPGSPVGLPVAAARNHGARVALARGAQTLVFLDVDCLPDPALLGRLAEVVAQHPDALVSGTVTYLPPADPGEWRPETLRAARQPHAARPDPRPGAVATLDAALFWSLCFAVTAATWRRLGGFHEGYLGYGGEDTDLAVTAAGAGIGMLMAGGADAFHLHHPVSDPPLEHVDDILRNAAIFERRHGRRPMHGWLDAFAERGLLDDTGRRRSAAPRVASIPPRHAYVDAVTPPTVVRVAPGRVHAWEPDPLFDPAVVREKADGIDVVHLHFGYDHLDAEHLDAWLRALAAARLPLVVTVHDLRNPHHATRERHDAHLAALLRAADRVLTLTAGAADELARRHGRDAEVVPHPPLVEWPVRVGARGRDHVLVPLKALRRNVVDPVPLVEAVRRGAASAGMRVRVVVEPGAVEDPRLCGLRDLDVDVQVRPYLPHDELCDLVAAARACVLPYRFGTHSGWVELCRDLGTRVVAPDCGHYAGQWDDVLTYRHNEQDGLDRASLVGAVATALRLPPAVPAPHREREALRDQVMAFHDVLYRRTVRS